MRSWLQTWWLKVPTPREFSVLYTALYSIAFVTGISTIAMPPITLSNQLGSPLYIMSIGLMLIIGAAVGMVGGARRWWQVERIGLWFMGSAGAIYVGVVTVLHFTQPGARQLQIAWIVFGLGAFAARWLMIRRFQFQPWG